MKAVLSGIDIPELRAEIDKLRVRKSEHEDIIGRREASTRRVDPKCIENLFRDSVDNFNPENMRSIIRRHVTKIYAHADGSYSVNVSIHINGKTDAT